LNARFLEVCELSKDVIRCDATTISGDRGVMEEGLVQFGHSKDDPSWPQIKVVMGVGSLGDAPGDGCAVG
jgi:transposase